MLVSAGRHCDVYSLGVVFYELFAGQMPYEIKRANLHEPHRSSGTLPTPLGKVRADVADDVASEALAKDREQRYQSAFGLAEDIRRFLSGQAINPASPSTPFAVIGHEGRVIWENTMLVLEQLLEGMVKGLAAARGE